MKKKKIIILFSAILLVCIISLITILTANNQLFGQTHYSKQTENTEDKLKEEQIVSDKIIEIFNQPLKTEDVPIINTTELEQIVLNKDNLIDDENLKVEEEKDTQSLNNSANNTTKEQTKLNETEIKLINDDKNSKTENTNISILQDDLIKPEVPVVDSTVSTVNSLTINFNKTINAKTYICTYGTDISDLKNFGTIISTLNDSYQCFISGLEEGTGYYVKLTAINGDLTTESEIQYLKTNYLTPTRATLISHIEGSDFIKISYSLSEYADRYSCKYKLATESNWNMSGNLVLNSDNVYCEINELKENSLYDVVLISTNGTAETSSEKSQFKTFYIMPDLPSIENINTSKNEIDIYFNKTLNSTSFICRYGFSESNLNNFGIVTIDNEMVKCGLTNLNSNTKYFVEIIAYNHNVSNSLDIFEVTTNQLTELSTPVLIESTSTNAEIAAIFNTYLGNPTEYSCNYGTSINNLNMKGNIIYKTNTTATCQLSNLNEGQNYYISLTASNEDYQKISDTYALKTEYSTPNKVTLNSKNISTNSLDLTFTKSANATNYICYYGTSESNVNLKADVSVNQNEIECSINNLNQGTDYFIKVVSINGDKQISSDIFNATTEYIKPSVPVIKDTFSTENAIKAVYGLSENATDYLAYYSTDNKIFIPTQANVTSSNVEISLNNLKENTTYYLKLTAINSYEISTSGEVVSLKTQSKDIDVPLLINSISTDSSITLTYNATDNLDLYVCYYGTNENDLTNSVNAINTGSNTRQCVLSNLAENTKYYFKMNIIKGDKIVNSEIKNIQTQYKLPTIPEMINKSITNNSFQVSFNIASNISNYSCKIGTDASNISKVIDSSLSGNTLNCYVDNLSSKTIYYVELEVTNGDKSIKSEIIPIVTTYNVPSKAVFINEEKTANSIIANFSLTDNTTDYICYIGTDFNNMTVLGDVIVESNQVKCSFKNLNQGTNYLYKLVSTNNNEIFTSSDIKLSRTEYLEPNKPITSSVYSNDNTITLTYPLNNVSESYVCKYGESENDLSSSGVVSVTLSNTITCSATNLKESTDYYFQVTVKNGNKFTNSDILKVSTKTKEIIVEPELLVPEYLGIGTQYSGYVSLNYTKVENSYIQYCYYGTSEGNLGYRVTATNINGNMQCQLNNLDPALDYFVKMRAYKADGITYSESVVQKIEAAIYTPEAPVLTNSLNDFQNIINTYTTNGYSKGYKCYIGTSEKNMSESGTFASHGNTQYCAYTNLTPGTTYYTKIVNIYESKQTPSVTTKINTDIKNGCLGTGPDISNITDYTSKVNSSCSILEGDVQVSKAHNVALALASIDALKVLKDYPTYDFKSLAEISPIKDSNGYISGYRTNVVLYTPGNMSDIIGQYSLNNNFNRIWIVDLY